MLSGFTAPALPPLKAPALQGNARSKALFLLRVLFSTCLVHFSWRAPGVLEDPVLCAQDRSQPHPATFLIIWLPVELASREGVNGQADQTVLPPDFLFLIINECSSTNFFFSYLNPSSGLANRKEHYIMRVKAGRRHKVSFGIVTHRC